MLYAWAKYEVITNPCVLKAACKYWYALNDGRSDSVTMLGFVILGVALAAPYYIDTVEQ
jgi:hypothetical protein